MEALTLAQLFGVNAVQDDQYLIINKNDLPLLTPDTNNSAESLLVAVTLKALANIQGFLETENGEILTDENDNPLTFNNQDYYSLNLFRWQDAIIKINDYLIVRNTIFLESFTLYENQ